MKCDNINKSRRIKITNADKLPRRLREHMTITRGEEEYLRDLASNFVKLHTNHYGLSIRDLAQIILLELERPVGQRRHEHIWRVYAWLSEARRESELKDIETAAADPGVTLERRKERHG